MYLRWADVESKSCVPNIGRVLLVGFLWQVLRGGASIFLFCIPFLLRAAFVSAHKVNAVLYRDGWLTMLFVVYKSSVKVRLESDKNFLW